MLDHVPLFTLAEPEEPLVAPAIVAALDGWIDAAGASTAAAERLAEGASPLASFDADALFESGRAWGLSVLRRAAD